MKAVLGGLGRRAFLALAGAAALAAIVAGGAVGSNGNGAGNDRLQRINHIVVVYEENHSFDNLYGGWEGVNGRSSADAAHTTQVDQNGNAYACLKQLDVNLTSPPLPADCTDPAHGITSHFTNTWFTIDDFIPATAKTCPDPQHAFSFTNGILDPNGLPGGCTRDLVHEFYQEQYQLNGGQQNRYMTGSDAVGTTMGVYDTKQLPIYRYLHAGGHPHYAIMDDLFQAAFGGSFLNHQWLIAAATPVYPGAPATLHSLVDSNGMPVAYPLYTPTGPVRRGPITATCDSLPASVSGLACGDYAVNTMRPPFQPSGFFGAQLPVPQTNPTIGDRLNAAGVDWAWYSGGWSNANGDVGGPGWTNGTTPGVCTDPDTISGAVYPNCANAVFQFHHQPFNYYAAFDPSTPAGLANRQAHLRDEQEFVGLAQGSGTTCDLKPVSFVKPLGQENEHPGYASEPNGSDHLVSLLQDIEGSACAKDTMVIVTYDEFGGQWDHVSPPKVDKWGPGTRVPGLVISPFLRGNEVIDHTQYDTTSILAAIEQRYGLAPLSTRDAAANSLADVFDAKQYEAAK